MCISSTEAPPRPTIQPWIQILSKVLVRLIWTKLLQSFSKSRTPHGSTSGISEDPTVKAKQDKNIYTQGSALQDWGGEREDGRCLTGCASAGAWPLSQRARQKGRPGWRKDVVWACSSRADDTGKEGASSPISSSSTLPRPHARRGPGSSNYRSIMTSWERDKMPAALNTAELQLCAYHLEFMLSRI
jgi:hypothetical protein